MNIYTDASLLDGVYGWAVVCEKDGNFTRTTGGDYGNFNPSTVEALAMKIALQKALLVEGDVTIVTDNPYIYHLLKGTDKRRNEISFVLRSELIDLASQKTNIKFVWQKSHTKEVRLSKWKATAKKTSICKEEYHTNPYVWGNALADIWAKWSRKRLSYS